MTDSERREAARKYINNWRGKGYEKGETAKAWIELLTVLGVENPTEYIQFEMPVKVKGQTKFIDAYIPATKVLIEQKGVNIDLDKPEPQSGGDLLTPFEQAFRYNSYLSYDERPRWIVVSNFAEIRIYDMNDLGGKYQSIRLENLREDIQYLDFILKKDVKAVTRELDLSKAAGEIVGQIYNALRLQYKNPDDPETLKSLNALCVRLVFCFFAEDAGVFQHGQFRDYMRLVPASKWHRELRALFKMLNTDYPDRDGYDPDLEAFPYVNGGLFDGSNNEIPAFTDDIVNLILDVGCAFNWREISPTIFGAVFESTLNPETRRSGGMHYTSIENIHKVIDPLFLDDLRAELETIKQAPVAGGSRTRQMRAFQKKLANLTFLDPACGSGNFLTETYLCIRRLENEVIRYLLAQDVGQMAFDEMADIGVEVSISQFYGIEINDFAVSVARTAMWIAEAQTLMEVGNTDRISNRFLPLKTNASIIEGNALRISWESVIPQSKLSYLMGNPPFVGHNYRNEQQKEDMQFVFQGQKTDKIDYVSAWFYKAAVYMEHSSVHAAFVATNSICQGVSIGILWKRLFSLGFLIDFAWATFAWDSEATEKAAVNVVIVGFSYNDLQRKPRLFQGGTITECKNINAYLLDAPNVCPDRRNLPISDVPAIRVGSLPRSAAFTITAEEKPEFIKDNPLCEQWIKPYIGSEEFINGKERYCLWLKDADPKELRLCKKVMERVEKVKKDRLSSPAATTRRTAATPTLFAVDAQPSTDYLVIPQVSSERRRYIPIGFMTPDIIASNLVFVVPDATLYHFGILTSNVHNAWMRVTCGRLEMRYRYGGDLVYNNFPWPNPTCEQKTKIEQTAQAILDARALYSNASLADLYDELTMPPELRKAHQANDRAVMQAYGFSVKDMSEADCVAELMKMYQELVNQQTK